MPVVPIGSGLAVWGFARSTYIDVDEIDGCTFVTVGDRTHAQILVIFVWAALFFVLMSSCAGITWYQTMPHVIWGPLRIGVVATVPLGLLGFAVYLARRSNQALTKVTLGPADSSHILIQTARGSRVVPLDLLALHPIHSESEVCKHTKSRYSLLLCEADRILLSIACRTELEAEEAKTTFERLGISFSATAVDIKHFDSGTSMTQLLDASLEIGERD